MTAGLIQAAYPLWSGVCAAILPTLVGLALIVRLALVPAASFEDVPD